MGLIACADCDNPVVLFFGLTLLAIPIPVFLNQRADGVYASMTADVKTMATAQETYLTDNPTKQGLAVEINEGGSALVGTERVYASPGNRITVTVPVTNRDPSDYYCVRVDNDDVDKPVYYNADDGVEITTTPCD